MATEDGDQPEEKRLFISGIAKTLSKNELETRLGSYGTLTDTLALNLKNSETIGIFAHCKISLSRVQWAKLKRLSGTVLKGSKLRIEEARPDWLARKAVDAARPDPVQPNPRKRPPFGLIPAVESKKVRRGEVVKDNDLSQKIGKAGWVKGRYGRAIAVLRLDGKAALKRNPDAITKLWGTTHPTSDQLTAWYDEDFEEWHDRRGRLIKDVAIKSKHRPVESTATGRVEIWASDDEEDENGSSALAERRSHPSQQSVETDSGMQLNVMSEEDIQAQLDKEREFSMNLLGDLFKDEISEEPRAPEMQVRKRKVDLLDIVQRYDPNAPEPETSSESEGPQMEPSLSDADANETHESETDRRADMHMNDIGDDESALQLDANAKLNPHAVSSTDLVSIFKPSADQPDRPFTLFSGHEDSDDEDGTDAQVPAVPVVEEHNDIHPDRLKQSNAPETEAAFDDNVNANFMALARDRGFSSLTSSSLAKPKGPFPLLLSSGPGTILYGVPDFFPETLDHDRIKRQWEEQRVDLTRDWKRKRREGTKRMRKAKARQAGGQ